MDGLPRDVEAEASVNKTPATLLKPTRTREWVTCRPTAWRTQPRGFGFKIDVYPAGWRVVEMVGAPEVPDGWAAVDPRGFVQRCDLVPCPSHSAAFQHHAGPTATPRVVPPLPMTSSLPRWRGPLAKIPPYEAARRASLLKRNAGSAAVPSTPPTRANPMPGVPSQPCPPLPSPRPPSPLQDSPWGRLGRCASTSMCAASPGQQVAEAQAALLALREEHVRLREANVSLREKELAKQRDLDILLHTRQALQSDLDSLREALELEEKEFQKQQERHRSKLSRCREAILRAVQSIDRMYEGREKAAQAFRTTPPKVGSEGTCPPSATNSSPLITEEDCNEHYKGSPEWADARTEATAAYEEVSAVLLEIDENVPQEILDKTKLQTQVQENSRVGGVRTPLRTLR